MTGYSAYKSSVLEDSDWTPLPFIWFDASEEFDQWTQEIRFSASLGDSIDYTVGAYYQHNDFRFLAKTPVQAGAVGFTVPAGPDAGNPLSLSSERDFDQTSDSWSVFALATFHVTERLRLIPGVRYGKERKEVDRANVLLDFGTDRVLDAANGIADIVLIGANAALGTLAFDEEDDRDESHTSPSFTVQFDLNNDVMLYGKASRSFKSGGFDASDRTGANGQYEDEQVTTYEVGAKTTLWDGRAELNVALFDSEYKDLQVQSFDGLSFLTTNAGEATSQGIELEGRVQLTDELLLTGAMAYLEAEYDEYADASCTPAQDAIFEAAMLPGSCTQDLGGSPLVYSSDWSANLNLNHAMILGNGLNVLSNLGVNYIGDHFVSPDLNVDSLQDGYTTVDARVTVLGIDDKWHVGLTVRNLTDKRAMSSSVNTPFLRDGSQSATIITPRTVVLNFGVKF